MKYGSLKAVCLIVLACVTVLSAYGDEVTTDLSSIVLEAFNGDTAHEWTVGSKTRNYEYSWAVAASKFATKNDNESYPKTTYVDAWPMALFGTNREGKTIKSFGINGNFDRRGYNWVDVYPVDSDGSTPFEIPIPGRTRNIDLWVWGSNLNYYIEAYIRDFQGVVHAIRLGDIAYTGWKNLKANIPNSIPQTKRIQPNLAQLHFVKFRIWTGPTENVNNFYIYFKQLKVLTDTFESLFDGDELADPDLVPEFWANSGDDAASN
ncbi:MAG: flagellar filament outer layer protein FlaA [Treponema sp.]|jgi:hypothetical protein|nr:flagellar filament outer layer protein FlaA [Treponema sp.]